MLVDNIIKWGKASYYIMLSLTPIGTAIGLYIHQRANIHNHSLTIIKEYEQQLSPKIYHLQHHLSKAEHLKIYKTSIQIMRNTLHKRTHNRKIINKVIHSKQGKSQIKQIQTCLKYRNVFKSFDIISIYIRQHMVNKHIAKEELCKTFINMYKRYYNKYVSRNVSCEEYVELCKHWIKKE